MALNREQIQLDVQINGTKAGKTYKDLKANIRDLNRELDKLEPGTEAFIQKSEELQKVKAQMSSVRDQINGIDRSILGTIKSSFTWKNALSGIATILPAIGAAQIFQGVVNFFKKSADDARIFEKSLSSLSAITGAVGEDLEFYKQQAADIGQTTTLSASQAVQAFETIGSARPELLKNKEALAAVTREAITLAEATGQDLPVAAQALTGILNQFNLTTTDSNRVINALAAGAKEGASAVPLISQSIDKFGVAARNANVSVEESVALVEVLGDANIKGAEAGTALRNVLSRMASAKALPAGAIAELEKYGVSVDILSDKNLSLEERLREFSKISGDATAITKVFGQENSIAGTVVLENVDRFAELTKAVTGTDEAMKQAAIQTDNYDSTVKAWDSALESVKITIGTLINQALRPLLVAGTAVLLTIKAIPEFYRENEVTIKSLVGAILLWNSQMIIANTRTLILAGALKAKAIGLGAVTIAQKALNAAMNANPLGRVIQVVSLLVAGFGLLYSKSETVRSGIAGIMAVVKEFFAIVKESFGAFFDSYTAFKDGRIGDALKSFGEGVIKSNPITIFQTQGKRLATAFVKGYKENSASEEMERQAKELAEKADVLSDTGVTLGEAVGDGLNEGLEDALSGGNTGAADKVKENVQNLMNLRKRELDIALERENLALEAKLANQEITEEEYETKRLETKRQYFADQLDLLKTSGEKDLNAFEELENKRLAFELEFIKKAAAKTAQAEKDAKDPKKVLESNEADLKDDESALLKGYAEDSEKYVRAGKFVELIKLEQQYNEDLEKLRIENYDTQLALLKEKGLEETDEFQRIQDLKYQAVVKTNKGIAENNERTRSFEEELTGYLKDNYNDLLDAGIEFLSADEEARKKHGAAIKALQIAQVSLNLIGELSTIAKTSAEYGVAAPLVAAIRSAVAIGRAISNISKIQAMQFAEGGQVPTLDSRAGKIRLSPNMKPTPKGDNIFAMVKRGETILNDRQVSSLGGPARMREIGVPGYAGGGRVVPTTVNTDPSVAVRDEIPGPAGSDMAVIEKLDELIDLVGQWPLEVRGKWVLSEFESVRSQAETIQNKYSL